MIARGRDRAGRGLLAREPWAREPDLVRSVDEFNRLPGEEAGHVLHEVCSSDSWVIAMRAARPYASLDALLRGSDAAVAAMSRSDLGDALAGHPRLGASPVANSRPSPWSAQEQAGIASNDEAARRALAEGNAEYERRFGHIYLACATGRSAAGLLAFMRERLSHDPEREWRVVAAELAQINRIRLAKLIGGAI